MQVRTFGPPLYPQCLPSWQQARKKKESAFLFFSPPPLSFLCFFLFLFVVYLKKATFIFDPTPSEGKYKFANSRGMHFDKIAKCDIHLKMRLFILYRKTCVSQ
eukprot:GEMP01119239.1.p1 GENE.GEMP01119239.1~~GEMP01119239.1.p1  ORF type:complete len:103 (-),score=1.38 GEMP01119239.1:265-573(-)